MTVTRAARVFGIARRTVSGWMKQKAVEHWLMEPELVKCLKALGEGDTLTVWARPAGPQLA